MNDITETENVITFYPSSGEHISKKSQLYFTLAKLLIPGGALYTHLYSD